jgi:c-di-GMP-binding flagellar brake protein YcgR
VTGQPSFDPRLQAGYLNENLLIEIGRVGSDLVLRATLDVLNVGHSLGLRPADDPGDLDAFQPNDVVRSRFSRPDDAAYEFNSRVLDVDGRNQLLWVQSPTNIERIQARRHVRVSTPLAGEIAAAGPRPLADAHGGFRTVSVSDISAGGMAVRTDLVLEPGSIVLVDVLVPDRKGTLTVGARARVVRCSVDSPPDQPTAYRYGLEYVDLSSKVEAQLVASVFWQLSQRRL